MVSNYDRIYVEIQEEAKRVEREHSVPASTLTELVMAIVDTEDRNRIRPLGNVNRQIENMITEAAGSMSRSGGERQC